jgi:hypothetical protein
MATDMPEILVAWDSIIGSVICTLRCNVNTNAVHLHMLMQVQQERACEMEKS